VGASRTPGSTKRSMLPWATRGERRSSTQAVVKISPFVPLNALALERVHHSADPSQPVAPRRMLAFRCDSRVGISDDFCFDWSSVCWVSATRQP